MQNIQNATKAKLLAVSAALVSIALGIMGYVFLAIESASGRFTVAVSIIAAASSLVAIPILYYRA